MIIIRIEEKYLGLHIAKFPEEDDLYKLSKEKHQAKGKVDEDLIGWKGWQQNRTNIREN